MRYHQFKILEQEIAPNGDVSLLTPAQQLNYIKDNVMTLSDDLKQKVLDAMQKLKSYVKQEPVQQNEGIDDAVGLINNEIMQEISNLDQKAEDYLEQIAKKTGGEVHEFTIFVPGILELLVSLSLET